jgi:hypothetical protein
MGIPLTVETWRLSKSFRVEESECRISTTRGLARQNRGARCGRYVHRQRPSDGVSEDVEVEATPKAVSWLGIEADHWRLALPSGCAVLVAAEAAACIAGARLRNSNIKASWKRALTGSVY